VRIVIVGAGYVGLVSGVCFSDFGNDVVCVDANPSKIKSLNSGKVPIYEPGLGTLIDNNVKARRLSFTTDLKTAMKGAQVVFIAVGTPARHQDGFVNLSYVYQAAEQIAENLEGFTVIVTKSTVPVGTGDEIDEIISKKNPKADFSVVSNPEFLREGGAIQDFKRPDRIVIGTDDERARQLMRDLYRPLFIKDAPIVFTRRRTSELIKYAANAFLATKITFINEIADLCEVVGADVKEVSVGIDKTIAVLGLAFKPNTDDMRDSPSLKIIPALQKKGAIIKAYDPKAMEEAGHILENIEYCEGPYECIKNADAVVIMTEWDEFRALDFSRLKKIVKTPLLIDLRNIYEIEDVVSQGIEYISVGRIT